ncbi:hypothetical protein KFK09_022816 [Dendrobium nobile]|uniref:UFSP1/2/DUB catalytic domain-containing protein n=1 Tax=Dendrobium nobile TaxID=94219 RepID=A0A8T3AJE0_DENNO|nr:hypothetical protein KFK09_022816 [Dendrobium nobile]
MDRNNLVSRELPLCFDKVRMVSDGGTALIVLTVFLHPADIGIIVTPVLIIDYSNAPAYLEEPSGGFSGGSSEISKSTFNENHLGLREVLLQERISCLVGLQIKSTFYKVEGGIMYLLRRCLQLENRKCIIGCGWRNIQMLSSHLLMQRKEARDVLFGGSEFVHDILSLQRWLEIAWERGFDVPGSNSFNKEVYGSKKWIGTTECVALFRSFGLRARVVDFDSLPSSSPSTSYTRFDATKERIGSGHNRYFVVPFGGLTTRFRGPRVITVYLAVPFGSKTAGDGPLSYTGLPLYPTYLKILITIIVSDIRTCVHSDSLYFQYTVVIHKYPFAGDRCIYYDLLKMFSAHVQSSFKVHCSFSFESGLFVLFEFKIGPSVLIFHPKFQQPPGVSPV